MAPQTTVYSRPLVANGTRDNLSSTSVESYPQNHALGFPPVLISILSSLLIPTCLLYLAIYAHVVERYRLFRTLIFSSVAAFLALPFLIPAQCASIQSLQYCAIAIGTMRALDIFARRHALPTYNHLPRPHPLKFSFILLTELRFESFTPNNIRVPHSIEKFSESTQLTIHMGGFALLQALPQTHPTILAFEVLLSIYIILETMQMAVRYKSSPALFGPVYKADSLAGFWSETWHNVFASPCQSLAYSPIRHKLPLWGVPLPIARSFGVLAAFCLMAIFHVAVLIPLLPIDGLLRVGLFFLLNGVGTVVEDSIWGKRKHWLKAMMAWTFEVLLATWTAQTAQIPNGFGQIPWRDICWGLR